MYISLIK